MIRFTGSPGPAHPRPLSILNRFLFISCALGLACLLLSCETDNSTSTTSLDSDSAPMPMQGSDVIHDDSSNGMGYPPGPYGENTGEVLSDLMFTSRDDQRLSLSQLREQSSKRFLLLAATATWCTSCAEEMRRLDEVIKTPEGTELEVIVAIFEDAAFEPASAETAATWRNYYEFNFEVVADPEFLLGRYYDASATPMFMLVEQESMTIQLVVTGLRLTDILDQAQSVP